MTIQMKTTELIFSMVMLHKVVVDFKFLEILKRYHLTESYPEVLSTCGNTSILFSLWSLKFFLMLWGSVGCRQVSHRLDIIHVQTVTEQCNEENDSLTVMGLGWRFKVITPFKVVAFAGWLFSLSLEVLTTPLAQTFSSTKKGKRSLK